VSRVEAEPAEGGPWLAPGEARPSLLLFPEAIDAETEAACADGLVGGIIVPAAALSAFSVSARRHCVALLGLDVAGIDGIHLSAPADVAGTRARLGAGQVVGAACGLSRHAAMVAGEAGADYVMFGALDEAADEVLELVAWWSELFVVPCAAAGRLDAAAALALLDAGADFLAVRHPTAAVTQALQPPP
jgi:hypothetical protein